MSGPIVRTGTTPEFWKNWDQVFGNKSQNAANEKETTVTTKATKKSAAPKKGAKKSVKKAAKKK
jgi:hypothetical protein